ncbi:hypothetical protein NA78x_000383 [Anatilimnocola sp. NA78]|uniref:hypothetical protein n=1 Tax=Anatilimnocola sp. NA78 TaxID=3415683 RepID=UPI003CE4DB86
MYDTLIMLKPGATFATDDLHRIVSDVAKSGQAKVERSGGQIRLVADGGFIEIGSNDAPHVLQESDEIAKRFSIPCQGCSKRFEMTSEDPEMDLFNDYLMINEQLQSTGLFTIFDTQECKFLFGEG